MKEKILIADDEECIRATFEAFLISGGYQVATADTLSRCIKKMQEELFDLLFLDISFGVENGLEAIKGLKVLQPECAIVVITGNPQLQSLVEAKKCGAHDYLVKPVYQTSLLYNVKKTLATKTATNQ